MAQVVIHFTDSGAFALDIPFRDTHDRMRGYTLMYSNVDKDTLDMARQTGFLTIGDETRNFVIYPLNSGAVAKLEVYS